MQTMDWYEFVIIVCDMLTKLMIIRMFKDNCIHLIYWQTSLLYLIWEMLQSHMNMVGILTKGAIITNLEPPIAWVIHSTQQVKQFGFLLYNNTNTYSNWTMIKINISIFMNG